MSFLAFKDYKIGIFNTIMDNPPFDGPRRNLVSDDLLEELKTRDEQTREIKVGPKPKVAIIRQSMAITNESENSSANEARPVSPETLRAEAFFNSLN